MVNKYSKPVANRNFKSAHEKSIDKFDGITQYEMDAKGDCRHVELANRVHTHTSIDTPLDRQSKDNKW